MKRYMDLIRKILEHMECHVQPGHLMPEPEIAGYTPGQVQYHIELCIQAGYARVTVPGSDLIELTWQGHEALDAFRARD